MSPRTALSVAALALSALAVLSPTASAGPLADRVAGCDDRVYERPFSQWLDIFQYVHMPDGGLEAGGEGWTLTGGAAVVEGNESFYVHDDADSKSLSLPAGSSATTAPTCAGLDHPTMRFFAKRTKGSLLSTLRVDALYEDSAGRVGVLPNIGVVVALGSSWRPTLPMVVLGSMLPAVVGDEAVVAFRFTPSAGSAWRIDDVYLDPFAKH